MFHFLHTLINQYIEKDKIDDLIYKKNINIIYSGVWCTNNILFLVVIYTLLKDIFLFKILELELNK